MPGGLGSITQILGMLGGGRMGGMGGHGGMGGMGGPGGMGGMGPGGMQQTQQTQKTQQTETVVDEYDVDRWLGVEDNSDTTAIEQVRADWDQRKEKKKKRWSIFTKRSKKKKEPPAEEASGTRRPRPAPTAERNRSAAKPGMPTPTPTSAPVPVPEPVKETLPKSMEMQQPWSVGAYFRTNPVNSTILAMDSLSLGPLTLNQLSRPPFPMAEKPEMAEQPVENYMGNRKEISEGRKYNVRIVN